MAKASNVLDESSILLDASGAKSIQRCYTRRKKWEILSTASIFEVHCFIKSLTDPFSRSFFHKRLHALLEYHDFAVRNMYAELIEYVHISLWRPLGIYDSRSGKRAVRQRRNFICSSKSDCRSEKTDSLNKPGCRAVDAQRRFWVRKSNSVTNVVWSPHCTKQQTGWHVRKTFIHAEFIRDQ